MRVEPHTIKTTSSSSLVNTKRQRPVPRQNGPRQGEIEMLLGALSGVARDEKVIELQHGCAWKSSILANSSAA